MKILQYSLLTLIVLFVLWHLLGLFYFKSMSSSRDSLFYPTYQKTASPFATFNVLNYSADLDEESVKQVMTAFAQSNNMVIDMGSRRQAEVLRLTLQRKDIRIKVLNIKVTDDYLHVSLYKEDYLPSFEEKEYREIFDSLIGVFRELSLDISDIKFDWSKTRTE